MGIFEDAMRGPRFRASLEMGCPAMDYVDGVDWVDPRRSIDIAFSI